MLALKNNDTAFLNKWDKQLHDQDISDIQMLCNFIKKYGFPSNKTFGKGTCDMAGILIHWAKEYPEWFNEDNVVNMLKEQVTAGNLRLCDIDMVYFFFISFTHPDIRYMARTNQSRMQYGLMPYSKDQFLGLKPVTPMLSENDRQRFERSSP